MKVWMGRGEPGVLLLRGLKGGGGRGDRSLTQELSSTDRPERFRAKASLGVLAGRGQENKHPGLILLLASPLHTHWPNPSRSQGEGRTSCWVHGKSASRAERRVEEDEGWPGGNNGRLLAQRIMKTRTGKSDEYKLCSLHPINLESCALLSIATWSTDGMSVSKTKPGAGKQLQPQHRFQSRGIDYCSLQTSGKVIKGKSRMRMAAGGLK